MTELSLCLDGHGLEHLYALIGEKWKLFGGGALSDWLTAISLFISTDGHEVTVTGEVEYLDFEREDETYSRLQVSSGAGGLGKAAAAGYLYYHHQGEEVTDVRILRETVSEFIDGARTWTLTTDIAIVFVLESGVIAVARVNYHSELLCVVQARTVQDLVVDQLLSSWTNLVDRTYEFERRMIPVSELLGMDKDSSRES